MFTQKYTTNMASNYFYFIFSNFSFLSTVSTILVRTNLVPYLFLRSRSHQLLPYQWCSIIKQVSRKKNADTFPKPIKINNGLEIRIKLFFLFVFYSFESLPCVR